MLRRSLHFDLAINPCRIRKWQSVRVSFCSAVEKTKKKDYAKTLLLPKTSFPMRANAAQVEPKYQKRCTSELYEWQQKRYEEDPDAHPLWVTHDGPPYANGSPHIGHSLNKILKDVVNRYKIMKGNTVSYIPGWDCHGLPIELKALQDGHFQNHQYEDLDSALKLRKAAKKVASSAIKSQKKHFMEWGVLGDWNKPYLTLLPAYESAQISVFHDLFKQGIIYQGVRPVHWSPSSNTALAEAELEYPETHRSLSVFCGFPIIKESMTKELSDIVDRVAPTSCVRLLIWTTTPWTLPANKGVCIHPDIEYCLARVEKKENDQEMSPPSSDIFVVAKTRMEYISKTCEQTFTKIIDLPNGCLTNGTYEGVLHAGKIYQADFVTDSSGTGLVHCAPGHGQDDFKVLSGIHKVEPFCPVDHLGKFTEEAGPDFHGKEVLGDGNQAVIDKIKENGMFVQQHYYAHKYPYDWRTKKPVIVRTTKQWFADLRPIIPKAVKALDDVEMIPLFGKERFVKLIPQREDWCISRQRCWGFPIPVFFHKDSGDTLVNDETISHLKELFATKGSDCWWSLPIEELLPPSYADSASLYERCFDTLDVWFDSGVSWNSVIKERGLPKADLYLEGSDQYRGWFQSSLLTSIGVTNEAPFKRIITHGFVLDGEGRKMSKSIGNVIDPAIILRGGDGSPTPYGADVLRMWVGSVDYTKDVTISYSHIQVLSETKRKIRNTVRFMLSNVNDLQAPLPYDQLLSVDKYMLAELHAFAEQITLNYDQFQFQKASILIQQTCISDWSSFYFESAKDRLYADHPGSLSRQSAQTVLAHSLVILTKVLAPVLCHMSEEIFENISDTLKACLFSLPKDGSKVFSIFQTGWISLPSEWKNDELVREWQLIKDVKTTVNQQLEQLRRDKVIRLGMDASITLAVDTSSPLGKSLLEKKDLLHLILNVSSVHIDHESEKTTPAVAIKPSTKGKCERCWLLVVDEHSSENCICERCSRVLQGEH